MQKRWVSVIVVALVVVGLIQTVHSKPSVVMGQAGSDAPYLYYFSDRAHAWVIERADGTDRRLFGYGFIPSELNEAGYVQWSPSGKWLSWYGDDLCGFSDGGRPCREYEQWLVLGAGSNPRLNSLEGRTIENLTWSPTEDALLVKEALEYNTPTQTCRDETPCPVSRARFSLLDAATDRELWSFERSFTTDVYGLWGGVWLNDGQTVVFSYLVGNYDSGQYSIIVIGRDGQRIERTLLADWVVMSPEGVAVYPRGADLWLMDLKTGQIRTMSSGGLEIPPYKIQWMPSGDGALIEIPIRANSRYEYSDLWWLDMQTERLSLVASHVKQFLSSPSFRFVYFIDDQQTLYYFDTIHRQVILLMKMSNGMELKWTTDDQLQLWRTDYQNNLTSGIIENLATGINIPFAAAFQAGGCTDPPSLSSDGRYWAWVDLGPAIYDRQTNQQITLREDARGVMSARGIGVEWHPYKPWFLTLDDGLVAGGGCGPIYKGVASADGKVQREIYSYYVAWLPDNVSLDRIPSDTTPQLPAPVVTLHGANFSFYICWSPDGEFLAADNNVFRSGYKRQAFLTWDVANATALAQFGPPAGFYNFSAHYLSIEWRQVPSGVFVPIRITDIPPELSGWDADSIRAISPDRMLVLVEDNWRRSQVFDTETHQLVFTPSEAGYRIADASFSPDGRLFAATTYYEPMLRIWDTQTWQLLTEIEIAGLAVAFSPDGQYLAVGVSWDVEIWRVSDLIGAGE